MSLPTSSSLSVSSATSISVPKSASFIGGSDDAVLIEMIVLMSTTDRLRDTLRNSVSAASPFIDAIETLTEKMNRFGKLIKDTWVPVTYSSLKSSARDEVSLRALFAADGPNLGETLAESQAQLALLTENGISLSAPKQTPVMVEQFLASGGKIDLTSSPASASVSWKSDADVQAIQPASTPGVFPGSLVKTVEVRDSNNKLVSVTRYSVFVDYANLRPQRADMSLAFMAFQQKMLPLLSELEERLSQVLVSMNLLDERVRTDKSKVLEDQGTIESNQQSRSDALKDALRLLRVFRIELDNFRLIAEKAEMNDKKSDSAVSNSQSFTQNAAETRE